MMSPALFPLQSKASERALVISLTRIVEFTFKQVLVTSNLFFFYFFFKLFIIVFLPTPGGNWLLQA